MSEPAKKGVPAVYRSPWLWIIAAAIVLLIILQTLRERPAPHPEAPGPAATAGSEGRSDER